MRSAGTTKTASGVPGDECIAHATYWQFPEFTIQHPLWFKLARLWDRRKLG